MGKLAVKIIQLLDGTPAKKKKRQAGQSVVELALITPILIVLLSGLVEIGWFANNYLNMLDVSRTGARRASVLQDTKSPLFWDNRFSYVPTSLFAAQDPPIVGYDMPVSAANGTNDERFRFRWMPDFTGVPDSLGPNVCQENLGYDRAFYNEVICTMITSMEPLSINPMNGMDDIVVSAFSLQLIDATAHSNFLAPGYDTSQLQMVVVGRYPSNANECNVINGGGVPVVLQGGGRSGEGRDPFDFNGNNHIDVKPFPWNGIIDGMDDFTELAGYDAPVGGAFDAEKQVGFSLYGNHRLDGTFCVGSEWTTTEIEQLMNLPNYGLQDNAEKEMLPSQGVVMVEVFWEHEMLLKIPLLSPVFTAVGNEEGKMVISVWAAFPQSAVEPHIQFP